MTAIDNTPVPSPTASPVPVTLPVAVPGRAPLVVLLTGTFLVVLDFFIVNVALPSMQTDLGMGSTALQWVVVGYGLAFGGLLMVATRLGDRHGRRRVLATATGLFVLASAACGLAAGTETLLLARVVQGAAAAGIAPLVLVLIGDVYDGPARLRALGSYSTVMGLAAVSGQLVGGVLIHADLFDLGWRSIFLVNVPVGLAVLATVSRVLPDTRVDGTPRVDLVETLLSAGAPVLLMLGLSEGRAQGWPLWVGAALAGSVLMAGALGLRSRALRAAGRRPMLDVTALRSRAVALGMVGQFMLFAGMASYFLVLALYLQDGLGLGALASGAVFGLVAVPYMAGTRLSGRLAALGPRLVVLGASVFTLGHLALLLAAAKAPGTGWTWTLAPGLAVGGLGMGLTLSALVATVMGAVAAEHAGTVSGTASTVQQLGNALGVVAVGLVFFAQADRGVAHAFTASLVYLAVTTAAVAGLALVLPRR